MNLNDLDLNLLRVFHQLMIERRVSSAAESLGVSQPAVSNALKRLRSLLGDELFLRTAQGMLPTPLAEQIAEPIAYAMDSIRAAMNQQVHFDPASAQREFVMSLIDLGDMFFLPPLLTQVCQQAPGVRINVARSLTSTLKDDMEAGRIDIAIGLLPQLQGSFFRQRLFRQSYVLAFRREHPLARQATVTQADFIGCEHVVVSPGTGHGEIDRLMERKGIERRIRATVPHFNAIGSILEATDLVATIPLRLAEMLRRPFGISFVHHPVELPEVSIDIFWNARLHRDPANQWLRRLIFRLFSDQQIGGA
ncbi:MAG: LysR family transcriptional regulator [Gammaproteobacteria bacterium]|jgi:DNA-binding transcriptional LysR family regulator|nr:LysR family transcriptional regulator [Gammaproteobacteria bacterium]